MGRSRGGLTCKIHAVVDTKGLPVRLALIAGEAHDNRLAGTLLSHLKSGTMLLADRGYDADWIRALVRQHGAWANIPPKRNRTEALCFSPYFTGARNLVERFFNKINHCRRVAPRYDKLAANYPAFVQLASIRLLLRINESTSAQKTARLCGRKMRKAYCGRGGEFTCWRCSGAIYASQVASGRASRARLQAARLRFIRRYPDTDTRLPDKPATWNWRAYQRLAERLSRLDAKAGRKRSNLLTKRVTTRLLRPMHEYGLRLNETISNR